MQTTEGIPWPHLYPCGGLSSGLADLLAHWGGEGQVGSGGKDTQQDGQGCKANFPTF